MRIYIIDVDGNMHPLENNESLYINIGENNSALLMGSFPLCKDHPMSDLITARDYITSALYDLQSQNPTLVVIDLRSVLNPSQP